MGRLIEVQDAQHCASLPIQRDDVLQFHATGRRIKSGSTVVEMLGPFLQGMVGVDGSILTPQGPPNAVLFCARQSGRAVIEVVAGDPWHGPETVSIQVTVE